MFKMSQNLEYVGGGVSMNLLWENPAPTAVFAPQTVTINNISQYKLVMILFRNSMAVAPVGDSSTIFEASGGTNGSSGAYQTRAFQIKSDGIQFFGGVQGGVTGNNSFMIPCSIYGIQI